MTTYTCAACKKEYSINEQLTSHIDRDNNNVCDRCGLPVVTGNTVTFNTNGGVPATFTRNVAANAPLSSTGNISDPTKSGCTFKGWQRDSSGSLFTGQSTLLDSNTLNSQTFTAPTTFYAIWQVEATGLSGSISATSNIGATLWNHISGKCTSYLGKSPASVTFESPLPSSSNGVLYLSGTTAAQSGTPYFETSFRNMTFQPGTSGTSYRLYYTAKDSTGYNTVKGYVDISGQATASTITVSVAPNKTAYFDSDVFQKAYRAAGFTDTLSYVTFPNVSGNYSNFSGRVYNGSTELSASNWSTGTYTYSSGINALSLRAPSGAKSDSFSTTYRAYSRSGAYAQGTLELKVTGTTGKGDVTYSVDPGKEIDFDSRDFNKAFQDRYGSSSRTLAYVEFIAPTSYTSFRGTVYVGSSAFDRSDLNRSYFYYDSRDAGRNDYTLDRMSFRADSNAKNGDSITIPFRAYYSTGSSSYVECNLVITIGKGTSATGDINYDVAPGKTVTFNQRDFRDFYEDNTSSGTLDYVEFDQPSSSTFNNGTLYHNYGTNSSKSFNRTTIDDFKFYYSPGSKDYGVGNLTFVATSSFKTTVTLDFTAYGTNGRSVSGTVSIASTESDEDGDITYTVTPGKSVDLRRTDFNTYFRKKYNSTVSYVVFARPSSTSIFNNGTLYCDYGTNSQTSFSRSDLSGTKFYYNKKDVGRNDYYLDELTFVAGTNFKDSITLDFTAYGERDDEYVEGSLVIKADGTAAITSNYTGGIRYATTTGTNVQINANDIARYFRKSYPTYNLQYVTLGGVPAAGSLYYNYYNASSYGTTSRTQITSANYAGQSFYLSPSSTSQYALTELTYVPSGTSYCASIPFTAYGTSGISVTGSILISVSRAPVSEVYGVTPRNTAVSFPASAIYSAVLSATGSALSGIQLLELPAATTGAVYIGTGTDRADTRTMYTYAAGANQMSLLRFVPTASYTGSVEIPYVALDANGNALATGFFSLGVLNNRKTLKDVDSSTWCYKYVMELTDQNVISGYSDGSFKPNSTVTYGAALKLIMLAAGYPEQAPTGKNVFSGYLTRAQADGIVTRSNVNLSAPITRLQVAQLAAGALKLSTSNLSSVRPFTDTSDVYVQALNAAGIVEGYFSNGTSTFRPSATLTRGQMSAIVWRMNEYRK
ncbi:S-layer homology domain-containing protein [uncultured Oscillibacter sp.]|uniref:S-layer homology domain-containing protein n=1 Tax=uncultured Oscillibacter sp. TaxID=876091 RepID=UPI002612A575|nr:S-layer homology domain-containing protein [uncultured Oscillibacter sp.]